MSNYLQQAKDIISRTVTAVTGDPDEQEHYRHTILKRFGGNYDLIAAMLAIADQAGKLEDFKAKIDAALSDCPNPPYPTGRHDHYSLKYLPDAIAIVKELAGYASDDPATFPAMERQIFRQLRITGYAELSDAINIAIERLGFTMDEIRALTMAPYLEQYAPAAEAARNRIAALSKRLPA